VRRYLLVAALALHTLYSFTQSPYKNIPPSPNGIVARSGTCAANITIGAYLAQCYPGADASVKINACEAAANAAGGGRCDATSLGGNQAMSQQITVLGGTTLILPQTANWTWDLTDGTSAGILQLNGSSIIGTAFGGGGNSMKLLATSSAHMLALYATDPSPVDGGSYLFASGFAAQNVLAPGAVFAHGVVYTRNLFDESLIERVTADNKYGDAWHILNVCCTTTFFEDQAGSGGGTIGGTPLVVEPGSGSLNGSSFQWSGTINNPGNGHPNVDIQAHNYTIDFPNVYMEPNEDPTDIGTPMINIDTSLNYPQLRLYGGLMIPPAGKPCFNKPSLVNLLNLGVCHPNLTMNNPILTAPVLTAYTVAKLPAASYVGANAFVIVTDSASFTPGPCKGGGSDQMIATSNGKTWTCH
jgi:hypothetical protein